jgi:hypothetical protein
MTAIANREDSARLSTFHPRSNTNPNHTNPPRQVAFNPPIKETTMNAITTYPNLYDETLTIIDQHGNDETIYLPVSSVFDFDDHLIRTLQTSSSCIDELSSEPWFIAKDACKALGIRTKRSLRRVHSTDKNTITNATNGKEIAVVNELGLYELIFQSQKPEARAFSNAVGAGYLPEIVISTVV